MAAKRTVLLLNDSGEFASGHSQDALQVLGVLGSGGNGTVLLCSLSPPEGGPVHVAVKQVNTRAAHQGQIPGQCNGFIGSDAANANEVGHLTREAKIHSCMRSDHVVRCLGVVSSTTDVNRCMGIVMECCPMVGSGLSAAIRRNLLTKLSFMHEALLGLQHVHSQGFVHLDVKMSNFVGHPAKAGYRSAIFKLTDFGHAAKKDKELFYPRGTVTHMAPEVLAIRPNEITTFVPAHASMDVYSFGMTVVEALYPTTFDKVLESFSGRSLSEMLGEAHEDNGGSFFQLVEEKWQDVKCEPWLRVFLERCLQHDPTQRPTVDQLLGEVQMQIFLAVAGMPGPRQGPEVPASPMNPAEPQASQSRSENESEPSVNYTPCEGVDEIALDVLKRERQSADEAVWSVEEGMAGYVWGLKRQRSGGEGMGGDVRGVKCTWSRKRPREQVPSAAGPQQSVVCRRKRLVLAML